MRKILFPSLLIVFLLVSGCAQRSFQKQMIRFDQLYIPALFYTEQGSVEASRKAVKDLMEFWQTFSLAYYNSRPADPEWKQSFDIVDQRITTAGKLVKNGKAVTSAFNELDVIRDILYRIRKRNDIKYYVDHLTEFFQPMDAMLLILKDKTPDTLTATDLQNLSYLINREINIWDKVAKVEFNSVLFGFNGIKLRDMRKYIKAEQLILYKLKKAIDARDKAFIFLSADFIKPNFNKLYLLFGDFGPP